MLLSATALCPWLLGFERMCCVVLSVPLLLKLVSMVDDNWY
jgi:hypothetical protein